MSSVVETWTIKSFLNYLEDLDRNKTDRRIAFILGSGASFSSGIPTGGMLVNEWLETLHHRLCHGKTLLDQWANEENLGIPGFDYQDRASFYPQVFERRFRRDQNEGFEDLERLMDKAKPSFGYSVLAQIMDTTRHNVVVTTNFDNLVANALALYAGRYPLVVGHESLARFARARIQRPLVAKIHRDLFLNPINDQDGTSNLAEGWKTALTRLFETHTPLVVGYGGNDGSLMDFLMSLKPNHIPGSIFWAYREQDGPPQGQIQELLEYHQGVLLPIVGFDEFMLQIRLAFGLNDLTETIKTNADRHIKRYQEQTEALQKTIDKQADSASAKAMQQLIKQTSNWWQVELKAREATTDDEREKYYQAGIKQYPDSAELHGNFADFLTGIRKNHDDAEKHYHQALDIEPEDAVTLGNFALFLTNIRKDYDKAEELYIKVLELTPEDALTLNNFANFQKNIRKDYDKAEELYRQALALKPEHVGIIRNFTNFLTDIRKNHNEAEKHYRKALELEPENAGIIGNFSNFLTDIRKNHDEAEKYYRKALELEPENAGIIGNFANFLTDIRKNHNEAEKHYRKALELESENAGIIGNFANFLTDIHKNYDKAEELYRQALELTPEDALILNNLANFQKNIRKDYDKAEELYRQALALKPERVGIIRNFAIFQKNIRKDYDKAEELYIKALELEPENTVIIGNFADFLTDIRKNHDDAEKLYNQALTLEPENAVIIGNFADFLTDIRKNHDDAEKLYNQALALEPENAEIIGNFAIFQTTIRQDYQKAEALYLEEIRLNPDNANSLANYSYLLVVTKRFDNAKYFAAQSWNLGQSNQNQITAEVALYLMVLDQITAQSSDIATKLKWLLHTGFTRGNWSFDDLWDALTEPLGQQLEYFKAIGEAILDEDKVSELDGFQQWVDIQPATEEEMKVPVE